MPPTSSKNKPRSALLRTLDVGLSPVAWLFFGLVLVVILPLSRGGWHLPGDAGDTLLNNIFLEHFYRWLQGLEPSYWSPRYFFPFPWTLAWSENLLGSAPIYAVLRIVGLSRESAHFGWYLLGYVANFSAAYWVLRRLRIGAFAAAAAAFFFAFGLPMMNQEGHNQLLYRWCVPLACYALYRFAQERELRHAVAALMFLTLQIYTNLYTGVFLFLLLTAQVLLMPYFVTGSAPKRGWRALIWLPMALPAAWRGANPRRRLPLVLAAVCALILIAALAYPYILVARLYGFARQWNEISTMLPRAESYFFAPNSYLWSSTAALFRGLPTSEHGIFPGLAVLLLLGVGLLTRFERPANDAARLHLSSLAALVLLTLSVYGVSVYWLAAKLPGFGAMRAIARIQLVNMWPLALYSAVVLDGLLRARSRWLDLRAVVAMVAALLLTESVAIRHYRVSFEQFRARRHAIRKQLPHVLPQSKPILFVADRPKEAFWLQELAAMAVAQDLGWSTLNGYSGYVPPGYTRALDCAALPSRLLGYLRWARRADNSRYRALMKRVVLVGFSDCHRAWWKAIPTMSHGSRDLARADFRRVQLTLREVVQQGPTKARVKIDIANHSQRVIHTHSTKGHHVRLSWRWVDVAAGKPLGGFDARVQLPGDLRPGETQRVELSVTIPLEAKRQLALEVSMVQEGVFWLHDLGVEPPRVPLERQGAAQK